MGDRLKRHLPHRQRKKNKGQSCDWPLGRNSGAGNETRTRDPDLGKVVLYQLSYSRFEDAHFIAEVVFVNHIYSLFSATGSALPWLSVSLMRIIGQAAFR